MKYDMITIAWFEQWLLFIMETSDICVTDMHDSGITHDTDDTYRTHEIMLYCNTCLDNMFFFKNGAAWIFTEHG